MPTEKEAADGLNHKHTREQNGYTCYKHNNNPACNEETGIIPAGEKSNITTGRQERVDVAK